LLAWVLVINFQRESVIFPVGGSFIFNVQQAIKLNSKNQEIEKNIKHGFVGLTSVIYIINNLCATFS